MISVKVMIVLSLIGIGASTLGVGAYVSSHPGEPVKSPREEEVAVARLPFQTRFELALPTSTEAARSTETKQLMLEPVLIYGRTTTVRGPKASTGRD